MSSKPGSAVGVHEQEEALRLFVEQGPTAIAMLDCDMRYLLVSRRWLSDHRLGDRDLVGLSHYDVFPELPPRWREIHRRCLAGAVESCEADSLPRADGSLDWIRWSVRPWRRADESIGGLIIFSEFVTERVRAEQALRSSEALLQAVSSVAQVGGWEVDPATGAGQWTEELARIHELDPGVQPNQEMGLSFYPGESREQLREALQEAVRQGKPYDLELEFVSALGTHKWVRTICQPELLEGKVVRLRGSLQDVTVRKTYELRIERLNRLYSTLSQANQSIVCSLSRAELFAELCRVMIEFGHFLAVWVGWRSGLEGDITTVAFQARSNEAVPLECRNGAWVMEEAFHSGSSCTCDRLEHPQAELCRGRLSELGAQSCAAFPLHVHGRVEGAFCVSSREPGFFNAEERRLLGEIASNVSLGLERLDEQERRRRAERRVRNSEARYRLVTENSSDIIWLYDLSTQRFVYVSPAVTRFCGFKPREILRMSLAQALSAESYGFVEGHLPERLAAFARGEEGARVQVHRLETMTRGGGCVPTEVVTTLVTDGRGRATHLQGVTRDISERVRAEESLRLETQRFQMLATASATLLAGEDAEDGHLQLCRAVTQHLGCRVFLYYLLDEASGRLCLSGWGGVEGGEVAAVHWLDRSVCGPDDGWFRALGLRAHYCHPLRVQGHLLGTLSFGCGTREVFAAEEIDLIRSLADQLAMVLQRSLALRLLRSSEEHFRAIFEMVSIGMAQADCYSGRLLRVNRKMCEITRYAPEELLQMTVSRLTHPDDRRADGELFQAVVRGEVPEYHMEKRYVRKDGTTAWADVHMTVIRDDVGAPLRALATIQDISQRREAEEERLRLVSAVEQAAESIFITDTGGTIVYVNPAFERITGFSRQEAVGQNPRLFKSGKHDECFYRELWATLQRGEVWRGRLSNKRKDGRMYEEEATLSPIRDARGKTVNYLAVKLDVTREVELEGQFRQAQKLESLGQLAGGVAHDLNNILTSMIMQSQLAQMVEVLSPGAQAAFEQILRDAERAANLTRQLLLFSRKQVMQPRDVDLNQVVTNLVKMLQRIIGEDVRPRLLLHPGPLKVRADAGMLDQVLLNLAVNARDAMPGGGLLTFKTVAEWVDEARARVHPDVRPGLFVCLSVSDAGCGITPEVQERMFEPFFTTKGPGRGTGLGLSTVFGIVKQHEGWIQVESALGMGTTFKIFLPACGADSLTEAPVAEPPPRGGTETILVVEDDQEVRVAFTTLLRRYGYEVLAAANGGEALKLWQQRKHEVALLLTDMVMPGGLSGQGLAELLRAENPGLRVIFASGYSEDLAGRELKLFPGQSFLHKPMSPGDLLRAVRNSLE